MTDAIDAPRILVVEDEPETAGLLGHILEVDGYRVLHAYDCACAMELAKRRPGVEAVLVDFELIEELPEDLPVIVVERPLSLQRLRELLRRVHEWAPFPDESRSATAEGA